MKFIRLTHLNGHPCHIPVWRIVIVEEYRDSSQILIGSKVQVEGRKCEYNGEFLYTKMSVEDILATLQTLQ